MLTPTLVVVETSVTEDGDEETKPVVEDSGGSEDKTSRFALFAGRLNPNELETTEGDCVVTLMELTATEVVFVIDDDDEEVVNAWASGFRLCRVV